MSTDATQWATDVDPNVVTCGQLHPEFGVPCELELGHSTLGASGRERAHRGVVHYPNARWSVVWTFMVDHEWRVCMRRMGRHPASGNEPR